MSKNTVFMEKQKMDPETIAQKIDELKALTKVNADAQTRRIEIESQIAKDPYVQHLYEEEKYEQLIFLELRRMNQLISTGLQRLQSIHEALKSQNPPIQDPILSTPLAKPTSIFPPVKRGRKPKKTVDTNES